MVNLNVMYSADYSFCTGKLNEYIGVTAVSCTGGSRLSQIFGSMKISPGY